MNTQGAFVIIDDDPDHHFLFREALETLQYPNQILFFTDGQEALHYLYNSKDLPFLIFSDINLPKMNGFELREHIRNTPHNVKCVPCLFFTTSYREETIEEAYCYSAQGFFTKPARFDMLVNTLDIIVKYWKTCESPRFS